jgi:hypothetical protein
VEAVSPAPSVLKCRQSDQDNRNQANWYFRLDNRKGGDDRPANLAGEYNYRAPAYAVSRALVPC